MKLNLSKFLVAALVTSPCMADQDSMSDLTKSFNSSEQLCVGYKASKQVMWGNTDVIGINCKIMIELKNQTEIQLTLSPVFDSGNKKRDRHVAELLGSDKKIVVLFTNENLKSLPEKNVTVNGIIRILEKETPIKVLISRLDNDFYGVSFPTTFSDLRLERPKVGPFGVFGSVNEDLLLFGRISANKAMTLIPTEQTK